MRMNEVKSTVAAICGMIALTTGTALAGTCPTDLDGDGATGFSDLTTMLNAWGPCPGCAADLDGDDAVGFSDLTQLLNAWGPCPIDTFEYPAYYEDMFSVEVGLQFLGPTGPLVLSEPDYNRIDRDIALMEAARPEIAGSPHTWRWVPFNMLIGIDTELPRDAFDALVAFYQGEVLNEYFDGSIVLVDFPMGASPWALIPTFDALPEVTFAEENGFAGTSPITPRWEPASVGGGALLWTVVVGWENGGICPAGGACDCFSTYEFLITADGTLTLLSLTSLESPFGAVSDCTGYPPVAP